MGKIMVVAMILLLGIPVSVVSEEYINVKNCPLPSPTIKKLIQCESGAYNVRILDSNGKFSYGVLQYQKATWEAWEKQSGMIGNPMNPTDAVLMGEWALQNNLGNNWSCYKVVVK